MYSCHVAFKDCILALFRASKNLSDLIVKSIDLRLEFPDLVLRDSVSVKLLQLAVNALLGGLDNMSASPTDCIYSSLQGQARLVCLRSSQNCFHGFTSLFELFKGEQFELTTVVMVL